MILEKVWNLFFGVVSYFFNLIPSFDLSWSVSDTAIAPIVDVVAYFLPLPALVTCAAIIFVLDNAKFAINLFNFIIRKIPGIN